MGDDTAHEIDTEIEVSDFSGQVANAAQGNVCKVTFRYNFRVKTQARIASEMKNGEPNL
jgi:hypothetical protein